MNSLGAKVIIDIDRVFAEINNKRKAASLPQIEHVVMRVRMNIRLAIKGIKNLPNEGPITVASEALNDIASTLNELFQVDYTPERLLAFELRPVAPSPKEAAVPERKAPTKAFPEEQAPAEQPPAQPSASGETSRIYLSDLFAAINQSRRSRHLPPIEPAVITVRTGVRFSILRKRQLDFTQAYLDLDQGDLAALTDILKDQFDVELPDGLRALIAAGRQREKEKPRKLSWLKRLFRKRRFDINVPALIMAVMSQRAKLGYRPIAPAQIKKSMGAHLPTLGIELTPNTTDITLDEAQMDRLAEYLREEYGLYFTDLESFIKTGH